MKIYVRIWSLASRICNRFKFVFHLTIFFILKIPKRSVCMSLPSNSSWLMSPTQRKLRCRFELQMFSSLKTYQRTKKKRRSKKKIYKQNINIQTHSSMHVTLKWKLEVTDSVYSMKTTHNEKVSQAKKIYFRGFFEKGSFSSEKGCPAVSK